MQFKNKKKYYFKKNSISTSRAHQVLKIQPSNGPALDLY